MFERQRRSLLDYHNCCLQFIRYKCVILDNKDCIVLQTKLIADKDIVIESGPEPETPEKAC